VGVFSRDGKEQVGDNSPKDGNTCFVRMGVLPHGIAIEQASRWAKGESVQLLGALTRKWERRGQAFPTGGTTEFPSLVKKNTTDREGKAHEKETKLA